MNKIVYLLFFLVSLLLSSDNIIFDSPFLSDSIRNDINQLLDYNKISNKISRKIDKAIFYQSVSFEIYQKTLNFELKTKNILLEYSELINSLENRLKLQPTILSYALGAPLFDVHFKPSSIDKKSLKNNFHYNELESIKNQYLELLKYHDKMIYVCESRISELLKILDKNSINSIYNDIVLEKHILVMNFTNTSNVEKYDKLTTTFPDMIVNRYKDREDISVMHSGSIDPDLNKINSLSSDNDRLLVDGSFSIKGYDININYKVYNVNNWNLYSNQTLSCDLRDVECIYDNFLWHFEETINPLIENYSYDDFSDNNIQKKIIDKNINNTSDIRKSDDLFKVVLEDFVIQKDYAFNINYKSMDINNNSNEFTKEFNFENHPNSTKSRKEISDNLIAIISKFLKNPYDIQVGELDMQFNINDNAYVDLWIPVSFEINQNNFEYLIQDFRYNTLDSKENLHIYEFLYQNYVFNDNQIQSFNNYDNEIFPVLFFSDKDDNIQKIIIDSWDSKYDNLLFGDYDVVRIELFNQLFSVIESSNSMYLNIKKEPKMIKYKATMPVSVLDNYTRLTIKMFSRSELDKYLPISELKF